MTGLHSEIHIESFRTLPSLHQAEEEGSLIYLRKMLTKKRSRKSSNTSRIHPVLAAPVSEKPFMIDVRVIDHSLGALLAQNNDQGYGQAIYYLSRAMIRAEHRYYPIEKEYLALSKKCDTI